MIDIRPVILETLQVLPPKDKLEEAVVLSSTKPLTTGNASRSQGVWNEGVDETFLGHFWNHHFCHNIWYAWSKYEHRLSFCTSVLIIIALRGLHIYFSGTQ